MARIGAASPKVPLTPPATPTDTGSLVVDLAEIDWGFDDSRISARQIELYNEAHAAWRSRVRTHLQSLHKQRNRRREWPIVAFMAENTGVRSAKQTLVEIEASGSFQLEHPERWRGVVAAFDAEKRRAARSAAGPSCDPLPLRA